MKPITEFFNALPKMIKRWKPEHRPPIHHATETVPLFCFGESLFANSPPGMLSLPNVPYWEAPLPFPKCWFYFCYQHPNPREAEKQKLRFPNVEHMIRVEPFEDRTLLTHYGRGATTFEVNKWSYLFVMRTFVNGTDTYAFDYGADSELRFEEKFQSNIPLGLYGKDVETLTDGVQLDLAIKLTALKSAYFVSLGSYLLAQPKTIQIEEVAVPDNRLRKMRNLPAIPPTKRIIHINYKVLKRQSTDHQIGITKPPHDRRAHTRRLYDGRVVTVRASKIHGGAKVPRVYEVRNDRW